VADFLVSCPISVKKWNASTMETDLRIFETNSALMVIAAGFLEAINVHLFQPVQCYMHTIDAPVFTV
jgi:hypothetical protein